jgi:hypothetical protein
MIRAVERGCTFSRSAFLMEEAEASFPLSHTSRLLISLLTSDSPDFPRPRQFVELLYSIVASSPPQIFPCLQHRESMISHYDLNFSLEDLQVLPHLFYTKSRLQSLDRQ